MPTPDVDPERILSVLARHDVRFVVIGGYAVELWGVAVPPTADIDITPDSSPDNLRHVAAALNDLGAALRVSGTDPVPVPGGFTPELISQMSVLNLATDFGPLDISVLPAGTAGYPDLVGGAAVFTIGRVKVSVAALEDVVRSKEAAGRPKDIRTLPALWDHLSRRRPG